MSDKSTNASGLVGLEVSPDTLNAVCVNEEGAILNTLESSFNPAEDTVGQIVEFVNNVRSEIGEFETLGLAVPGLVDRKSSRIAYSVHIPEHAQIDLSAKLHEATGLKVVIENDANAAAYGEFRFGAGRDANNIFYAMLGAGVGGAFIFDGKIWRGKTGFAGEFGYVAINAEGMRLEDVASARNIVRRTKSRISQDSTSSLSGSEDDGSLSLKNIITAAQNEDDLAQMMLARTGDYVGTAVASVINLLNVEKIVFGGELVTAGDLIVAPISNRARELSFAPSFNSTKIVVGDLGRFAAAVGAAVIAHEH